MSKDWKIRLDLFDLKNAPNRTDDFKNNHNNLYPDSKIEEISYHIDMLDEISIHD